VNLGLHIIEFWPSHSDTEHSVELLWTSNRSIAETSAWKHTTLTTDKHPYVLRDSSSESQQASGRRLTP